MEPSNHMTTIYCLVSEFNDGSGKACIIGAFTCEDDALSTLTMIEACEPGKSVTMHVVGLHYHRCV